MPQRQLKNVGAVGKDKRELCPAYGKTCSKCHKPNHFTVKCRSREQYPGKDVKTVEEEDMDEVFPTHISAIELDDSQLVTVHLESGSYLHFQIDTGTQCNVIPLNVYKEATKDRSLMKAIPTNSHITAYGGATLPVVVTVSYTYSEEPPE